MVTFQQIFDVDLVLVSAFDHWLDVREERLRCFLEMNENVFDSFGGEYWWSTRSLGLG